MCTYVLFPVFLSDCLKLSVWLISCCFSRHLITGSLLKGFNNIVILKQNQIRHD